MCIHNTHDCGARKVPRQRGGAEEEGGAEAEVGAKTGAPGTTREVAGPVDRGSVRLSGRGDA